MAAKTKTFEPLREYFPDGQIYGYTHVETGVRLIDIKRHPVTGYDPYCGKWNVFVPGRVFPVNAGSGTAAEWKSWVEENAARLVADKDN
jgi:hypothetical protein